MWRFLVLGLFLFIASPACAEPVAPPSPEPPAPEEALDYRWSLVLTDVAALATVAAGVAMDNEASMPLAVTGIGVYALGPGVVHLAHGQPGRAAISAGMRIGLPGILGGVTAGVILAGCDGPQVDDAGETSEDWCPFGAAVLGGLFAIGGAVTAAVIDDAVLGKVTPKDAPRGATWGVAPLVSPRRSAVGVSVVGAF